MIVLSEASDRLTPSPSARDIQSYTEAAHLTDCRVYSIPQDFRLCETAENALFHIPEQERETPGVWIGYIPTPEHYEAIYKAALDKRIQLLNSPDQHLTVQEFDRAYPHLEGLTPVSVTVSDATDCAAAVKSLGLPVFVKGAVQSRKARGWKACVAETLPELEALTRQMLSLAGRSRGRVIVRRLVRLRHSRASAEGFPFGREYRVFLYQGQVLGFGYYWEGDDPLQTLIPDEKRQVLALAQEAAWRLNVPYLAVDVGQTEAGEWIVIETGDAQFSGISQTPLLPLWNALRRAVEDWSV